jgi:hypothetical protein
MSNMRSLFLFLEDNLDLCELSDDLSDEKGYYATSFNDI